MYRHNVKTPNPKQDWDYSDLQRGFPVSRAKWVIYRRNRIWREFLVNPEGIVDGIRLAWRNGQSSSRPIPATFAQRI